MCGSIMEPRSEVGTKQGSSAWHATANHPDCGMNYEYNPGAYARDRMADYNLKCRVSLLRVHVRNSNKICSSNQRCALKKFDVLSEEANWAYIGRFMMPDPGNTVSSKTCSEYYFYLQNCASLPFETFTFSLDGNGIPYEAEHVAFVAGRHETNDGEAMEPYYRSNAAVSQIIFETTVGE